MKRKQRISTKELERLCKSLPEYQLDPDNTIVYKDALGCELTIYAFKAVKKEKAIQSTDDISKNTKKFIDVMLDGVITMPPLVRRSLLKRLCDSIPDWYTEIQPCTYADAYSKDNKDNK